MDAKKLESSRRYYVAQASTEYLMGLLLQSAFLSTLAKEIGIPDSLTGVITSFTSLGCLFQLLSFFLHRPKMKRMVMLFSIGWQSITVILFIFPVIPMDDGVKIAAFTALFMINQMVYNLIHPSKLAWLLSLVDNTRRGRFTATKDIVTLVSGIVFNFLIGAIIDYFSGKHQITIAFFVVSGIGALLSLSHTVILNNIVEPEIPRMPAANPFKVMGECIKDARLRKIVLVFSLYYIANFSCGPFFGSYQIKEMGFSLTFISVASFLGSFVRIMVSKAWGRYADRHSFANLLEKGFWVMAIAYLCVVVAVPSTGKVCFLLYYVLQGMAFGAIGNAVTNLVLDYVPVERRADSMAITTAIPGVIGFLTTLCISPLVSYIQSQNGLFGVSVYAQQVVTVIGLAAYIAAALYTRNVVEKMSKE